MWEAQRPECTWFERKDDKASHLPSQSSLLPRALCDPSDSPAMREGPGFSGAEEPVFRLGKIKHASLLILLGSCALDTGPETDLSPILCWGHSSCHRASPAGPVPPLLVPCSPSEGTVSPRLTPGISPSERVSSARRGEDPRSRPAVPTAEPVGQPARSTQVGVWTCATATARLQNRPPLCVCWGAVTPPAERTRKLRPAQLELSVRSVTEEGLSLQAPVS